MKKLSVFFLLFLTVAVFNVYAHPPSDIKITYDPATKMLEAVIFHDVNNPASHYIKKVDVGLNGQEVVGQVLSRQDNNESQTVKFLIPQVKTGDVLSVEGYCNISGKLEKKLKIS
jgi:hypothetical protein